MKPDTINISISGIVLQTFHYRPIQFICIRIEDQVTYFTSHDRTPKSKIYKIQEYNSIILVQTRQSEEMNEHFL